MIRSEEVRKGDAQIQFSLAALGDTRLQPKRRLDRERPTVQIAVAPRQLDISGEQVLIGTAIGICLLTIFIWGLRHLLFAL